MDERLKFRLWRWSVWCGLIVLAASTVAFFIVGNLTPPTDPTDDAQEVAKFMSDNRTGILWAAVIMGIFAPLFYPFAVVTSLVMRRVEGGWGLLSMVQLTTAVIAPTGWIYPLAMLATVAWRKGRDPELVLLLSDQYWLTYVGVAVIFSLNVAVIGITAFVDKSPEPVFPKWFGWMNIVLAIGFLPGVFVYVATDGPFAWNGLFAFMIPSTIFFVWKFAMIYVLLKAVKAEESNVLSGKVPAMA